MSISQSLTPQPQKNSTLSNQTSFICITSRNSGRFSLTSLKNRWQISFIIPKYTSLKNCSVSPTLQLASSTYSSLKVSFNPYNQILTFPLKFGTFGTPSKEFVRIIQAKYNTAVKYLPLNALDRAELPAIYTDFVKAVERGIIRNFLRCALRDCM